MLHPTVVSLNPHIGTGHSILPPTHRLSPLASHLSPAIVYSPSLSSRSPLRTTHCPQSVIADCPLPIVAVPISITYHSSAIAPPNP